MLSDVNSNVSFIIDKLSFSKSEVDEAAANELLTEHFIGCVVSTCIEVPVPDIKLKSGYD